MLSLIMTASKLRANIYNVLDKILETGVSVEIQRKGKTLKIVPMAGPSKLANLKKHDILNTSAESIVHMDWSDQWKS